jgi:hypothetical protein
MDEQRAILVDFMAAEHRLRRQAVKEAQQIALWKRRQLFALERDLPEMAGEAQARAERHAGLKRMLLARAEEIRSEIESMRGQLSPSRGLVRAPPTRSLDDLDRRLELLEIDRELEAIRARQGQSQPAPTVQRTSTVDV